MATLQLEKIEQKYLDDIKEASEGRGKVSNVIALGSYAKFLYEIKGERDRAMTFLSMEKACDKEAGEFNIDRNNGRKENSNRSKKAGAKPKRRPKTTQGYNIFPVTVFVAHLPNFGRHKARFGSCRGSLPACFNYQQGYLAPRSMQ